MFKNLTLDTIEIANIKITDVPVAYITGDRVPTLTKGVMEKMKDLVFVAKAKKLDTISFNH